MAHLSATTSSWAINDTANKTVTIAQGLLAAATSDDISPTALLACTSFGAVLPVSPETRMKIEQLARRNYTSRVLTFVQAQIGYRKDDSVEELSRSDSGIRFLCLVATLCTLDRYDAAERLDALLQATQKGQQIRPTLKQLQVMINCMRGKMILSDFATSVAGYEIMLRSFLAGLEESFRISVAQIPSKGSLQELILAMNELGRMGESGSVDAIEIKSSSSYAPWTCAFVKWLLGEPPLIRLAQGTVILPQRQPLVTITIVSRSSTTRPRKRGADGEEKLDVALLRPVKGLKELMFFEPIDEKRFAWEGLINAQTWVDYHFAVLYENFPQLRKEGTLRTALGQALYFIIAILPDRLILSEHFGFLKAGMSHYQSSMVDLIHSANPKAFVNRETRVRVTRLLLQQHISLVEDEIDESGALLPENLSRTLNGACHQCQKPSNGIIGGQLPCKVHDLLESVGELGSMLLMLSLFGPTPETFPMVKGGLLFATSRFHHRLFPLKKIDTLTSIHFLKLIITGWQGLMHGQCSYLSCPPIAIFQYAAKMMGHQNVLDSTIISSLNGQVLYPAFFEANDFLSEGVVQLCAFPGKLQQEGMQFDFMLDSLSHELNGPGLSDAETEEVDEEEESDPLTVAALGRRDLDEDGQIIGGIEGDLEPGSNVLTNADTPEIEFENDSPDARAEDQGLEGRREVHVKMVPSTFVGAKRDSNQTNQRCWKVSVRNDMLHGELRLQPQGDAVIAWSLIETVLRARLSPPCPHPYNKAAREVASSFELHSEISLRGSDHPRALLCVGQSYHRQLQALEVQDRYPPTVIHFYGCIQCALKMGLDNTVRTVIS